MRPLVTAQLLPNHDITLTCTICNEQEIVRAVFTEKQKRKFMMTFNRKHTKAHEQEPAIQDRVVKVEDLTRRSI